MHWAVEMGVRRKPGVRVRRRGRRGRAVEKAAGRGGDGVGRVGMAGPTPGTVLTWRGGVSVVWRGGCRREGAGRGRDCDACGRAGRGRPGCWMGDHWSGDEIVGIVGLI